MPEVPSRNILAALTQAANAVLPPVTLGLARSLDTSRLPIVYSYLHGIGEFVLDASEVPAVLWPQASDVPGQRCRE